MLNAVTVFVREINVGVLVVVVILDNQVQGCDIIHRSIGVFLLWHMKGRRVLIGPRLILFIAIGCRCGVKGRGHKKCGVYCLFIVRQTVCCAHNTCRVDKSPARGVAFPPKKQNKSLV